MKRLLQALALGVAVAISHGLSAAAAETKPLKIYVLAGQSNMQGMAKVRTIERLNMTEDSKQLYQDMEMKDGLPSAVKDTYGVYFTGGDMTKGVENPLSVRKGPFRPGYGAEVTENTTFGADHAFGIYMQKHVQGPILIIKTAWGGRNLLQQFRSPSAGPFESDKDRHGNPTGYYYQSMVKHVKTVLADPGQYHPAYNKEAGYEIAGFVWFQGFNDVIDSYYQGHMVEGKPLYFQYSDLLAAFIRDVRKDLNAPAMPFVIGAMGINGPIEDQKNPAYWFRKAQLAPADLPEFKGNVAGVRTEHYWDMEWQKIYNKLMEEVKKKILASDPKKGGQALNREMDKQRKEMAPGILTPEELKFYLAATSNAPFHYMGSAYTYSKIGKAFAEAMIAMEKK
jgi:alpha-galactosidase